jgi:hypothetical protein
VTVKTNSEFRKDPLFFKKRRRRRRRTPVALLQSTGYGKGQVTEMEFLRVSEGRIHRLCMPTWAKVKPIK